MTDKLLFKNRKNYYHIFTAVGGVRPLRVPAQGRHTDHPRADRPHQAIRRAVPGHPGVRHLVRR